MSWLESKGKGWNVKGESWVKDIKKSEWLDIEKKSKKKKVVRKIGRPNR